MNVKIMGAAAGLAGVAVLVGQMKVNALGAGDGASASDSRLNVRDAEDPAPPQPGGGAADVAVCDMPNWVKHGAVGSITAYSFGTTSVNVGTVNLNWVDGSPNHPVISQNMFRLKDGKFEHIGQSWLKHGFCALQLAGCGACDIQGGCLSFLKPGCRDPYDAGLNGFQGGLGPKFEVNASTGAFAWPYTADGVGGTTIYKRLQVATADLANAGALYFIEGHYIAPDDAFASNDDNNASYRRVSIDGSHDLTFQGSTQQQKPGIQAWKDHGLGAGVPDPNVTLTHIDVPGDGRFTLGHKVSDNGDGTWHYEYALYNMNSDRSGQAFRVPVPAGVTLTNIGFHDVPYHSGEPYVGTDWTVTTGGGEIVWASETEAANVNANALRWGTLYNFRFDADSPPIVEDVQVMPFKIRGVVLTAVSAQGPGVRTCPTDVNHDGVTNVLDLVQLLLCFGVPDTAPCDTGQDVNCDGTINVLDLIDLLLEFGNLCP